MKTNLEASRPDEELTTDGEVLNELEALYRETAHAFTEALQASMGKGPEAHRALLRRYEKRLTSLAIAMDHFACR